MYTKILKTIFLGLITIATGAASADMEWSDFSLSYLYGENYALTPDGRMSVVTVEHASGHSWGDNFLFVDRTMPRRGPRGGPRGGNASFYGELAPRLSLGKLSGNEIEFGPVRDVLAASTWEFGDGFNNYLFGAGVALAVPGFNYFNANVYRVLNDKIADDNQLTLTWAYPFRIGGSDFLIDGFMDWSSAASTHASELLFVPQIKWNMGRYLSWETDFYVGMEYSYWNNKYGIKDVVQRDLSLLLKWHF